MYYCGYRILAYGSSFPWSKGGARKGRQHKFIAL